MWGFGAKDYFSLVTFTTLPPPPQVGLSAAINHEPAFQHGQNLDPGIKSKLINLISAVRTLMRSEWSAEGRKTRADIGRQSHLS